MRHVLLSNLRRVLAFRVELWLSKDEIAFFDCYRNSSGFTMHLGKFQLDCNFPTLKGREAPRGIQQHSSDADQTSRSN